jgi:phosphonate transport system substrate-binding protein
MRVVHFFKMFFYLAFVLFAVVSPAFSEELALEVVVALKPDKDPEKMFSERTALAEALGAALGRPVKVIIPLSSAVIVEGLSNGSIDLGYLSATDMVNARKTNAADVLLVGEIDGERHYESLWISLADKPYSSIADLRDKPIAFASRTSTSGYLIPLLDLKNVGLISTKPEDLFGEGNVWYGTGYMSAVERVLAGEAEAAAVSDYVFEKDKHLTPEQKARLKVVDSQGPVPTHVLAISKRLSPDARQQLLKAVQDFSEKNPTLRDAVFTSLLVECDEDAHLLPVVNALDFVQGQQNQ